jgi:hypothetical protein
MSQSKPFRYCCRALIPLLPALCACSSDFSNAVFDDGAAGSPTAGSGGGEVGAGAGGADSAGEAGAGGANQAPRASAGGEAGAGGSDQEPPVCEPNGDEVCNERDDDCNGVVDDGCPGGIATTFEHDLQLLGDSAGGATFTDGCKDGELLGGVEVAMGAFLSQVRGVCRALSLELSPNAASGYRVRLKDSSSLDAHPAASSDAPSTLSCPVDEALVGVRVSQQYVTLLEGKVVPVIPQVWLSCAKLTLEETEAGYGVSWEGKRELAPASGSVANGTAWFASAEAPQGLVGSRLIGASGAWVDRLGFGVSRLAVVLR